MLENGDRVTLISDGSEGVIVSEMKQQKRGGVYGYDVNFGDEIVFVDATFLRKRESNE